MMRQLWARGIGTLAMAVLACGHARGLENVVALSYNKTAPTNAAIAHWTSGWTQPSTQPTGYTSTTGWNYVGNVNGTGAWASGVYLGYGWVLTAAHVGPGDFTLNGTKYPVVPNSGRSIGTADLTLFQISPAPQLPPLPLSGADPKDYTSQMIAIGYGDGAAKTAETWGCNMVTTVNQSISLMNSSWTSNDFITLTGTSTDGQATVTNLYQNVSGDSGGGDFIYNGTLHRWELAGINEVTGTVTYGDGSTQNFSGFVQVNTYAPQINAIILPPPDDAPTLPQWALGLLAVALVAVARPKAMRETSC